MKLKSMRVNSARADAGDWVDGLTGMDDLRLKVRGFSNPDYEKVVSREAAKVTRDQRVGGSRDGAILPQIRDRISIIAMVEALLLDWENLTDEDGTPVPYSKEKAMALLSDPDFRLFRDAVAQAANRVEEVIEDQVAGVAGN